MRTLQHVAPSLVLAFAALTVSGCACPTEPGGRPSASLDPAAAAAGGPSGRFVGSDRCAECHEAIHASWSSNRHRATLRPFAQEVSTPGGFGIDPFAMDAHGKGTGPDGSSGSLEVDAAYLVGGARRQDLWVRLPDGRLQVWPVSRDAATGETLLPVVRAAGGSEPPPESVHFWLGLGRSADFRCYGCHATGARLVVEGRTAAGNPVPRSRWVEAGVGCEACHGPGGLHVDAARSGDPHPAYASGDAARSCEGCHVLRELLDSPFAPSPAHSYGSDPWEDADPVQSAPSDAEFREPFFPDMRPSTYQQQATALAQSACARRGGLACADCHDPHGGPDPIDGPSGVSGICARCHGSIAADAAAHARHPAGGPGTRCEDCHMAPVLRGPASRPAVDHSLTTPVARAGEVPLACAVCHDRAEDREAVAARVSTAPRSEEGTRRLAIQDAVAASLEGSAVAAERLAGLASDPRESWFVRWSALRRIADLPPGTGAEAVRRAARSAADDPHPALRRIGLLVLGRWGGEADARAIAPRVESAPLPEAVAASNALVEMGVPDSGGRLTSLLRRPEAAGDYRAQAAFGSLALRARDWQRAERALSRSLELHPIQVRVQNELGIALWELGRFDEARTAWRMALEWNPGYEAARRNLEDSTP